MRVTKIGRTYPLASVTTIGGSGGLIGGTGNDGNGGDGLFPGSGQVPTAGGSNTWAWGSNVARIFSNGSNALLGPFVNFASGTGVTFAAASNTLTISAASSGTSLPWFDVKRDYGAAADGTTDDTTAIQNAINAAEAAGGGVVYFRAGVYKVAGALQDTGRGNAQLLIPDRAVATDTEITIHLLGESPPHGHSNTATGMVAPVGGAIIKSTLSSGTGALLGGWGPVGSFQDMTMVNVVLENLTFRMASNPTNSAVNMSHFIGGACYKVTIDTGQYPVSSVTQPTTTTSYGLRMPGFDNGGFSVARDVNVIGFYNGVEASELANLDVVGVWGCYYGFRFTATNHATWAGRLMAIWVKYIVHFDGAHYTDIEQLDIEHASSGWYQTTYDIDDASNYGIGSVTYHVVLAGTGPVSTFTKNGGSSFICTQIGSSGSGVTDHGALTGLADDDHPQYVLRNIVTTKGDLFARTSSHITRVASGSNTGDALVTDNNYVEGVRWGRLSGEILITDTPAGSPLVFADLMQNEAQDDLLYGDP